MHRVTSRDNKWSFRLNVFFWIREKKITKHSQEEPLNQRPKKGLFQLSADSKKQVLMKHTILKIYNDNMI